MRTFLIVLLVVEQLLNPSASSVVMGSPLSTIAVSHVMFLTVYLVAKMMFAMNVMKVFQSRTSNV